MGDLGDRGLEEGDSGGCMGGGIEQEQMQFLVRLNQVSPLMRRTAHGQTKATVGMLSAQRVREMLLRQVLELAAR